MSVDKKKELELERRIKMLEEEIQKMKEPLEKTLMDIRNLINDLENPFVYLTKLIGEIPEVRLKSEEKSQIPKVEQKAKAQELKSSTSHEVAKHNELPSRYISNYCIDNNLVRFLNVLAFTSVMSKLLGRENLLSMVNSAAWRAIIPSDVAVQIAEAIDMLKRLENDVCQHAILKKVSVEDGLVTMYLLSKLISGNDDPLFLLLLLFLNRLDVNQSWKLG